MKKVLFTAMAAVAMFALVSCNNKKAEEPVVAEEAAVEQCEHKCAHEGDSAMCCKKMQEGDTAMCCKKAEGEKCCKEEGKECDKKCEKAQ